MSIKIKCGLTLDTGQVGFCGTLRVKHFSGFGLFLLPNRIHARPSAMLRERKPLGAYTTKHHLEIYLE